MSETAVSDMQAPIGDARGIAGAGRAARRRRPAAMVGRQLRMESRKLNFFYGAKQALWDISLRDPARRR